MNDTPKVVLREHGEAIWFGWIEGEGSTPEERRANGYERIADEAEVIETLRLQADRVLPPGTRYELRRAIPLNFGRTKGIGWIWTSDMDALTEGAWNYWRAGYVEDGAYFLIGRYTARPS